MSKNKNDEGWKVFHYNIRDLKHLFKNKISFSIKMLIKIKDKGIKTDFFDNYRSIVDICDFLSGI